VFGELYAEVYMSVKHLYNVGIAQGWEVTFPLTPEEAVALQRALDTLQAYQQRASGEIGGWESDWAMYDFKILDGNVVVKVEVGACG
jgi:hypothetical protein